MDCKECISCNQFKNYSEFPVHHYNNKNIPVYRNQCNICRQKVTYNAFMCRRRNDIITKNKDNERKRLERKDPSKRARFILEDCRKVDKKKGRDNDLSIQFIKDCISNGCTYCDEKNLMIVLDRIDNTIGHTQNNVISACIRCNYIRNSMPYEAWIHIVPLIKDARINGLFNTWRTKFW